MAKIRPSLDDHAFLERALQATIRIGLIVLLVAACFATLRPFVVPVIWGIIIAVATSSVFFRLQSLLGGHRGLAATVYIVIALVALILPAALFAGTLLEAVRSLAANLSDGTVRVPPPPVRIQAWPLVGEPLYLFWELASDDLQAALNQIGPQLKAISRWFLNFAAKAAIGLAQFVIAVFIAAALLANATGGERVTNEIASRLMGPQGSAYADLVRNTIRSVAHGIIGIALLQSILAGLGFLVFGLPGAGFLAFLCLVLAVVQIGVSPVMIYAIVYGFYVADTTTAVIFAVWCVFVFLFDNVLKPLVLGRGVKVPMLVIFMGAVGGLLTSGLLGLFVGPVVLALGYTLFMAWLRKTRETALEATEPSPAEPGGSGQTGQTSSTR
jgi:predicted PurR-regulated permease PerM